jgi:SEC-C motif
MAIGRGHTTADRRGADLLFWRETGGRRMGLACVTQFCDNPECTCQEVHLQAFEVDESFHKLVVRGDSLKVYSEKRGDPPPNGQVTAVFDLETGRMVRVEHAAPREREPELRLWLEEAIDAPVQEELRERWRSFKAEMGRQAAGSSAEAWRDLDWTQWDGEEPVSWCEVHPETPWERFELEGAAYEAADHYCIRPGCDCGEVSIRFYRLEGDEIGEMIGEICLEAASGEVVATNNLPGERRVLERLWSAYEERHDLYQLSLRFQAMQRLGPEIRALRDRQLRPAPVRSAANVGRNDPCPCGSGRKYKRCCGARR